MEHHRLLSIYLNDHLALATVLIEVARRSLDNNDREPFRTALDGVHTSALEQRAALVSVMDELGVSRSVAKVRAAWVTEKAGRLKLNGRIKSYSPLSRVLESEGLRASLELQRSLWDTLGRLAARDPRVDPDTCSRMSRSCSDGIRNLESTQESAVAKAFETQSFET
ncbi:MAG: hypothetical protein ACR2KQ_04265 [Actinomycetota bacterium]